MSCQVSLGKSTAGGKAVNWKQEAVEKLRRYNAIHLATINIPQELERLEIEEQSSRATEVDDSATKHAGNRIDDTMLNNILYRKELIRNLQQARIWLKTTDHALNALNAQEQRILYWLYMYPERDGLTRLCKELGKETSSIYRYRDQALKHFTMAYYGIEN